jgi:integrase
MACLFKRSNGIWQIVESNGKGRQWTSTGTRCFGKALKTFKSRPPNRDRRRPCLISEFATDVASYASSNYSKGTRDLQAHSFNTFIRVVGNKLIRFITARDIEQFKTVRLRSVSPVSINVELQCLRSLFGVAVAWGSLSQNPFAKVNLLRVPNNEPSYLTKAEFEVLLKVVSNPEFRDVLRFGIGTMARRGEISNLLWEDIDFDRRVIHIRNKIDFTLKGRRPRVIPMSEMILRLLQEKQRKSRFVFSKPNGEPLKGEYLSHEFKKYVRKAGLSDQLHFHSLRHTGASWLVQQDVPLYAVQRILGHSAPLVTQIYSHLSDQNLRVAIERISIPSTVFPLN